MTILSISRVLVLFTAACLSGCGTVHSLSKLPEERVPLETFDVTRPPNPPVEADQPPVPAWQVPPAAAAAEGSLWQPNGAMSSLFVDYKARFVGDIVTIAIIEDAKASNDAGTNTGRQSDVSLQAKAFLNAENEFSESSKFPNPFGKISGGMENSFDGAGKTERSGTIKAEMTAKVVEVMPNGNLRIEGARMMTINSERQFIVLAGEIRPRDISSDNRIASTRISNARIVYSGSGVVDEQLRQGWLSRILNGIWPL